METKKLYLDQKHTLYEIEQELGLSSARLYRYWGSPSKIYAMPKGLLEQIAKIEGIDPKQLKKEMLEYAEWLAQERV